MNLNRICRNLLTALFFLSAFCPVQAQIRLAALGGIHSSDFTEKNQIPGYESANGQYYTSNTGFELGFLAEIPFGKNNLFFQPAILYSSKGNQFQRFYDSAVDHSDTLYNQHVLNLKYVEIPLYLTWKVSLSKNQKSHFYLSAGPYFAFIYSASLAYQNRVLQYNSSKYLYQSGTEDLPVGRDQGSYKTMDIGIGARAGFELGNVLIGAYFSHGFTNAYNSGYPSTFHNQLIGGSIGIWLNNPKPEPKKIIDTDNDGTPDPDDSCKTIPGSPKWHGCPVPDSDHDGINDEQDSCKMTPGLPRYNGCPVPDSDNDGINDEEDSCKYVPGFKDYHGCPIPDNDQDGLNNEVDKCPDQAGPPENNGCPVLAPPVVVKEAIVRQAALVAANVMFNSNSASLTRNSYPALRELADSMKANPELDLVIEGHTDNTGRHAQNLKLSGDRANAVKKVLLDLGISNDRIQIRSFGDTKPVESNNSEAGKAKNRRVAFVFQLKNR